MVNSKWTAFPVYNAFLAPSRYPKAVYIGLSFNYLHTVTHQQVAAVMQGVASPTGFKCLAQGHSDRQCTEPVQHVSHTRYSQGLCVCVRLWS